MSYREFTWSSVKEKFGLTAIEGGRFFPIIEPIEPSPWLQETLRRGIPWAMAVGGEKARSEAIIAPILLEVREILNSEVSVFSGEEFNVEPETGLNGYCDFLVSRSKEQIAVEAPVLIIIEAKKADIKLGLGQCAAEMVAAQKFNDRKGQSIKTIYGSVTTGTAWRFMKLEASTITVDLHDYSLPSAADILGLLVWMSQPHREDL
jgi:hypothetical protein